MLNVRNMVIASVAATSVMSAAGTMSVLTNQTTSFGSAASSPRRDEANVLISPTIVIPATKAAAERASSTLNILAGVTAFVGAVCSITRSSGCAGGAFLVSGAAWTGSGILTQTAIELGDPNFKVIATPDGPAVDVESLSPGAKPMVMGLVKAIGVANALYVTANRATAAAEAGSLYWTNQQLLTLDHYNTDLEAALKTLMSEIRDYVDTESISTQVMTGFSSYRALFAATSIYASAEMDHAAFRLLTSCLLVSGEDLVSTLHTTACHAVGKMLR